MDLNAELEQSIRELEARLPELRRLIADTMTGLLPAEGKGHLTRLLGELQQVNSVAGQVRLMLLSGDWIPEQFEESPKPSRHA